MKQKLTIILLLLIATLLTAQTQQTFLQLNTQMHTAMLRKISTDAENRYLLTCSDDKTAKLWDAATGSLIRTFRIPIGQGVEGMLYACAISPNAEIVAVGGFSCVGNCNQDIYIFNTQTGEMLTKITGLPNVILDLEFSESGKYLAAGLGEGGVRIYNIPNSISQVRNGGITEAAKLTGYGAMCNNVCFDRTGRLATVCYDGKVRLYNSSFGLITESSNLSGSQPFSLAFSSDGSKIAVGYCDKPNIDILSGSSLNMLYQPDLDGVANNGAFGYGLSFSSDGNYLYGGGSYLKQLNGNWRYIIRKWSEEGRGSFTDIATCGNTVLDIKPMNNGKMFFGGSQPDFGSIDSYGNVGYYKAGEVCDFALKDRYHLKVNSRADEVGFTPSGKKALTFSVSERKITEQSSTNPSYTDNYSGISVTDWKNSYSPKLNGNKLSFLKTNESSRSVDISSNNKVVFGANFSIYCLDNTGNKLWEAPVQGVAWAVNISGNNKVVAAALGNGTINWYRMTDGKLLLTLYVHPETNQWVLWTPSGYYDCSTGAEDLIGWHVNNGKDKEASFYPISKFRSIYYRPDVVGKVLETLDEEFALQRANEESGKKTVVKTDITQMLPPTVAIISPESGTSVKSTKITIRYTVNSPNNEPVTNIKVLINGRPYDNTRGMKIVKKEGEASLDIIIPEMDCKIGIIAENRFGFSEPAITSIIWSGNVKNEKQQEENLFKPKLYVLAIGVSKYDDKDLELALASKDATDFANSLRKQKGLLYSDVIIKLLDDKKATKDNILDGLEWIQKETTARDVAMVFLAGHGMNDNGGTFYYLPVNANTESIKRTCLPFGDLKSTVSSISGKVLLFVDACHSGNVMGNKRRSATVDINGFVNDLTSAENGAIVFTSSTGNQYSLEDKSWGNGAFTKALVEGLNGKADVYKKGKISVKALDFYIAERVKELTKGQQSPTTIIPGSVPDFPIVIVK